MDCRTASSDGSAAPPRGGDMLARTPAELLGDEVRAFREQRGLSLSQVAGLVFASKSLLSAIEHGQRTGTAGLIAAVDAVLQATGRIEALWPAAAAARRGPGRPSSCPTCQHGRTTADAGRMVPAVSRPADHATPQPEEQISEGLATQAVALAERALGRCADRDTIASGRVSIGGRVRRRRSAPRPAADGVSHPAGWRFDHVRVHQGDRGKARSGL